MFMVSRLPVFCASPILLVCRGRRGYAPCVRVLQLRWCLLGLQVRCASGLRCLRRLWAALAVSTALRGSWTAYSGHWMVQVPAVFLNLTLGSSLLLPVMAAGLRWLRFILSCPPSVALLWRG